ncbi:MAG: hypothetical protein HYS12_18000 [Planctomycetes bacterium]|nr:hypothetical protein [Planctomycetota bacterium]
MSRMRIAKGLLVSVCLLGAWLAGGAVRPVNADEAKKEPKVVVVEPEMFRKVIKAERRPSKEQPLEGLGAGLKGYYEDETVVIELTVEKLPRGEELRFALYRQQPYHWRATDSGLVKDVTKEVKEPGGTAQPPMRVGKAGLDKCYSFTGRGEKTILTFGYSTPREKKPIWVFKVVING